MRYRIKELREERGMTQQELAEKSGVSRTIVSKMENDEEPQTYTKTLLRLADALNVTVNDLFSP